MHFLSKPSADEKRALQRQKAENAAKEKQEEQRRRSAKTAELRALRLARDAQAEPPTKGKKKSAAK